MIYLFLCPVHFIHQAAPTYPQMLLQRVGLTGFLQPSGNRDLVL